MSVKNILKEVFKDKSFTLKEAYDACDGYSHDSVRARIYENLGVEFKKVIRGVYTTIDENCVLIEGNGRNLSCISDSSVDCIITDHPWQDKVSNKGGNRDFADYDTFEYTEEDFREKARVLKDGCFLCEIIPAENENNFDYLYRLKKTAQEAGFQYYAKVTWVKGTFVSNTGRKAKNTEELMIFSKGKARALKTDVKKSRKTGIHQYMSGTNGMLPTCFNVQQVSRKDRIATSEKPSELFEQLLEYLTRENEVVLDQFAGSGAVGEACIHKNRKAILIEKSHELVCRIQKRLQCDTVVSLECVSNSCPV